MTTPATSLQQRLAALHYAERVGLTAALAEVIAQWWAYISRSDITGSYAEVVGPGLVAAVTEAQRRAVVSAQPYVGAALDADSAPVGRLNPAAFTGTTQDGRSLESLLDLGRQHALRLVAAGEPVEAALTSGQDVTARAAVAEVQDAGRMADSVAMAAQPAVGGYTRYLQLPSCAPCVVLAGKLYKWSAGFERHPHCDCVHVPQSAGVNADPVYTDPEAALRSGLVQGLTPAEVKALEEGADLGTVVNAKRSKMRTVGGLQRRGGKLTPEAIYKLAGDDRDEALRLLEREGYLTPGARPRDLSATRDRVPLQREPEPEDTEAKRARLTAEVKALEDRGRQVYQAYNALRADLRQSAFRTARAELGDGPNGRAAFSRRVDELMQADPEHQRLTAEVREVTADLVRARDELTALPPPPLQDAGVRALPRKPVTPFGESPIDVDFDSAATNPGYGSTPRFGINCVHVVNTYELRRRGYDVTATPLPQALGNAGRNSQEALNRWRDPEGKTRQLETVTKRQLVKTVEAWPVGARGWVTIRWGRDYGGGGHIFAVEVTTNGVRWVEAQKGTVLENVNSYLGKAKTGKDALRVVRVDDLTPEDRVLEFVNERGAT